MGSLRKTLHTAVLPCLNHSQVPMFLMPWLLKSSELWCLEAEEGHDQSIQQAPVSHWECRSTSEHLGDWKSCSVHAQGNLNVALISNLQSPRPSPTQLVWKVFLFLKHFSKYLRSTPWYNYDCKAIKAPANPSNPESLMSKYTVCSYFLVLHVFCAAQLHKGQNPNKLWFMFSS